MISVAQIDQLLRERVRPTTEVDLPLAEAVGRCLRRDVVARRPAPPFDRVMMDGYALATRDPVAGVRRFRIAGTCPAGSRSDVSVPAEGAVEVMTGAVLPPGADAVIPVEDCQVEGDDLNVPEQAIQPGQFIHRCGSDYPQGAVVLPAGVRLHPAHLALVASEGIDRLMVNDDIRIHVITTGDEIVPPGTDPEAWQIFGTHAVAVAAAFAGAGDVRLETVHVSDHREALSEAIHSGVGAGADVVVVCGAMSKGRKDFGIEAIGHCGFDQWFHRAAQRPGHPMALAARGETLLFGLPGNPLAVLFTLFRHVLPAVERRRGAEPPAPARATVEGEIPALADATRYVPCRFDGQRATPTLPQNSGDLRCLAETDGFLEIPPANATPPQPTGTAPFRPWR